MFVITLITEALPSGPTWKTRPPIASNTGRCAAKTAGSPPTMTVICPDAARCTPPVTGASRQLDPLRGGERREALELVAVVRARVDPGPARREPLEQRRPRR